MAPFLGDLSQVKKIKQGPSPWIKLPLASLRDFMKKIPQMEIPILDIKITDLCNFLGHPVGDSSFRGFHGEGSPPGNPHLGHQNNNKPFGLYKPPGFEVSGPPSRHKPSPFNSGPPQQPIQNLGPNFGPPNSSNFQPSYGPDLGQGIGPRRPPNNEGMKK